MTYVKNGCPVLVQIMKSLKTGHTMFETISFQWNIPQKKLMIEVLFLLILFHNGSQVVRSPTHAIVFENDHGSGV